MSKNSHSISIYQYDKKGKLQETYSPLQNLIVDGELSSFTTNKLNYNLENYIDLNTQLSYDDSINLIINNNDESPRIINSQFRVLGNNTYEYLTRNYGCSTNMYDEDGLIQTSDLFLRSSIWPIIDLLGVETQGILMGGNYSFYIKYCDEDFNESEIVSESGIVSIFSGTLPSNIHGVILDTRTTKNVRLRIRNLDQSFDKFFIYFSRETSDINGINITKYYKIDEPYTIGDVVDVNINGYENIIDIGSDDLFKKYNYFSAAKTQAIVQNMLFVGNLKTSERNNPSLQQLTYHISTTLKQKDESIGYINRDYSVNWASDGEEYYDPLNIYYYLGYWPDEYYKLAVCYILGDGTVTEAFPLYGGMLTKDTPHKLSDFSNKIEINKLFNNLNNSGGVFKLPKIEVIDHKEPCIKPLYFEFAIDQNTIRNLKQLNVTGLFFVRAKRTPISLFQGLSLGVDELSGTIMPYITKNDKGRFIAESFVSDIIEDPTDMPWWDPYGAAVVLRNDFPSHQRETKTAAYSALLSLDACVEPELKSILSWSKFRLEEDYQCKIAQAGSSRHYQIREYSKPTYKHDIESELLYIEEDIPSMYMDGRYYSTRAGQAESAREFEFFNKEDTDKDALDLIRGVYTPFVGTNTVLNDASIYTVKINIDSEEQWVQSLLTNSAPYFSITNRMSLDDLKMSGDEAIITAYRGDCFVNTVTIRLNRNFIDPTFPANDKIIDQYTWNNYKGLYNMKTDSNDPEHENIDSSYGMINLGDINAVQLGQWITFKCLSNYNLGLRSIDTRDVAMMGQLGSSGKSFYPISGIDLSASGKIGESHLLNDGYNITLNRNVHYKWAPVPYENWNFENRIAFSNIAATKMFTNGFRVFQGLAYQDVDKSFGCIVKLFPYGQNLLCVFEHGLAIIPINEKALLSTQEGLSIHLYGAGVLQEQVSVISPDFGSTWMESIIKTPDAYYGVDTSAKKIWKFNNVEGFQCISDFKVQSFLNENLNIDINDSYYLGATSVRTHYDNFKGDVIFTFYNKDKSYSLCYNERLKTWVSRYSWMPLLSENIDNHFYSFDRSIVEKYTKVWQYSQKKTGIVCTNPFYDANGISINYEGLLKRGVTIKINSITFDNLPESFDRENISTSLIVSDDEIKGIYYYNKFGNKVTDYGIVNIPGLENNAIIYNSSDQLWYILNEYEDGSEEFIKVDSNHKLYSELKSYKLQHTMSNVNYSAIPIIVTDTDGVEYHDFYTAYIVNDKNKQNCKLFIPSTSEYGDVVVKLSAYYDDDKWIETYEFPISHNNFQDTLLHLYQHDISALPCEWYGNQEPFEYEFVVNQPLGLHKIFNNLMIISNNVEPDSLEVEIVGDSYDFKEEFISQNKNIKYKFPIISLPDNKTYQTKLTLDKVTNENRLIMHQDCLNIKDFGRRLGNISYIEGKWYVVLQPIYYEDKTLKTTRLRDKWAKIRIKYSGKKLAIITAIQTLMNISYA